MRVAIFGASGLVGTHLRSEFLTMGHDVVGTFRRRPFAGLEALDLDDPKAVAGFVRRHPHDVALVPAAWSNVEACEKDPALARHENEENLSSLVDLVGAVGARVVFFSTDYVFDGSAGPYREDAPTHPLNVYGRTKLFGERLVSRHGGLVIRTTVVYDFEPADSKNFLLQCLAKVRGGETMRVPDDQWGNPTPAPMLAQATRRLVEGGSKGIFHVAGREVIHRSDFAWRICDAFGLPRTGIVPVPTSALQQAAARPLRSGFIVEKVERTIGMQMWGVNEGLSRCRARMASTPAGDARAAA